MISLTLSSLAVGTSPGWPGWLPLLPIAFSVGYWGITARLLRRRFETEAEGLRRPATGRPPGPHPPVVFFRPVKHGVPGLREKARQLVAAARPGDQVLFGVGDGFPEDFAQCEAACAAAAPGVRAKVVLCGRGSVPNPKIAKLIELSRHVAPAGKPGPAHWIVTDSEALPGDGFMEAFRAEWNESGAAVLTAGYRFEGARNLPQWLDHLPALLTLWPGLAAAERLSRRTPGAPGLGFTLGACTGMARDDLAAVGGWEAFGAFLAEDNRLGAALAAAAPPRPVRLSGAILTLDSDPLGWRDWVCHQHRLALTYRVCSPGGALGMGFTQGIAWGFLLLVLHPRSPLGWGVFAAVAGVRIATARRNARLLGFPMGKRSAVFAFLLLAASLAETVFWLAAWLPLPVRWGDRWFKVRRDGLIPAAARPEAVLRPNPERDAISR